MPAYHYGGPVSSISDLCSALVSLGLDVTVFTTNANGETTLPINIDKEIVIDGVKVFRYPVKNQKSNFFFSPTMVKGLREHIKEFDLVHIHSIWNFPGIPAAFYSNKFNIPYIHSARGSLIMENQPGVYLNNIKKRIYFNLFLTRSFQNSAAVHYTAIQEYYQSDSKFRSISSAFVVGNGINCSDFEPIYSKQDAKKQLTIENVGPTSEIITYIGRLHSRKGLDYLIKAFNLVLDERPNAHLILAGPDYGYKDVLQKLVKDLGLETHVHFTGFVNPDKRLLLLNSSDIFALPSWRENFGISIAEAMACAIPVLVSKNVCIQNEIVEDGAGIATDLSVDQIALAILRILSDEQFKVQMGQRAYSSVRNRYDRLVVAEKMALAYEDIIQGKKSSKCEWVR